MEHARKMVLIPQELLRLVEEKQRQQIAPLAKTVQTLDRQMEETLQQSNLSPDVQMKLFDQQAQRWQTYQDKQSVPVSVTLQQSNSSPSPPTSETKDPVMEEVLDTIPKTFRNRAQWLLHRIKRSESLGWNEEGQLVVDGHPIPGTHIVDLVNDVVRKRKNVPTPSGWDVFARGLRRLHVPQEAIGNFDRWAYITEQPTKAEPVTPKTPKRSKHQEPPKWDPY